jgi:hypothetical protein
MPRRRLSARGAGLFHQTMAAGGVTSHFIAENLQGDLAAKARSPRAIHLTHAAGVERSDDFVAANRLTPCVWHGVTPIYRPGLTAVKAASLPVITLATRERTYDASVPGHCDGDVHVWCH